MSGLMKNEGEEWSGKLVNAFSHISRIRIKLWSFCVG